MRFAPKKNVRAFVFVAACVLLAPLAFAQTTAFAPVDCSAVQSKDLVTCLQKNLKDMATLLDQVKGDLDAHANKDVNFRACLFHWGLVTTSAILDTPVKRAQAKAILYYPPQRNTLTMVHCVNHMGQVADIYGVLPTHVEFWCMWPNDVGSESLSEYPYPHTTGQVAYTAPAGSGSNRIPSRNCGWTL